jgi:hypothetical protein
MTSALRLGVSRFFCGAALERHGCHFSVPFVVGTPGRLLDLLQNHALAERMANRLSDL